MTLGELVKGKSYIIAHYYIRMNQPHFKGDVYAGQFKVEDGKIISLDGDTYSESEEVVTYIDNVEDGVLRVVVEE